MILITPSRRRRRRPNMGRKANCRIGGGTMLSQEQNDRLTRVGPGTPMGELMRRYWHAIAGSSQLNEEHPTREVRLLGEDLVLFRSTAGKLGLLEPPCPHRNANLSYGIPEPEGIRCAYHGWLFDVEGNCVDQPSEPAGSRFKEKVQEDARRAGPHRRGGRRADERSPRSCSERDHRAAVRVVYVSGLRRGGRAVQGY